MGRSVAWFAVLSLAPSLAFYFATILASSVGYEGWGVLGWRSFRRLGRRERFVMRVS